MAWITSLLIFLTYPVSIFYFNVGKERINDWAYIMETIVTDCETICVVLRYAFCI